jgi:excisionase family DNA binding protein
MSEEIMTIRELAVFLKIKEKTAYKLAAEGKLPSFKVGGAWRFNLTDLFSILGRCPLSANSRQIINKR